jgi:hypothetical protein
VSVRACDESSSGLSVRASNEPRANVSVRASDEASSGVSVRASDESSAGVRSRSHSHSDFVAGDQAISNFLEGYELVVDLWKYINRRDD